MDNITLTSGMRSNLVALQQVDRGLSVTQQRLATGKKVNSALDNASNYFAAKAHNERAGMLLARKDGINEGIQTVKAANAGIEKVQKLIEAARGALTSARSTTDATALTNLATQFDGVMDQIDNIVSDSGYKGINLLDNDSIAVAFNEDNTTNLTVAGFDGTFTGLGLAKLTAGTAIDTAGEIDTLETGLNDALTTLRTSAASMSSNLSVLNIRNEFITDLTNVLKEGADNLTLADMNEEGANMLMLQTRQQLSTTALSLASQAAQSVLRLF